MEKTTQYWKQLTGPASLRTILILAFTIQALFITGAFSILALSGGKEAVNSITDQLLLEIDNRIQGQLQAFLGEAHKVNKVNLALLESGQINVSDQKRWREQFWRQREIFSTISFLSVADARGHWFGLQIYGDPTWHVVDDNGKRTYSINEDGSLGPLKEQIANYDTFKRPWFKLPRETLSRTWIPIYIWTTPRILSTTLSEPILDDEGAFDGVMTADLTLGAISAFFRTLDVGKNGRAFLIERDGALIASSDKVHQIPYQGEAGEPERINASECADMKVAQTTKLIQREVGLGTIQDSISLTAVIDKETNLIRISSIQENGLDWLLVVVLSEDDFIGGIYDSTLFTVSTCLVFLLLTFAFGVFFSRKISEPLMLISQEVLRIQDFHLDNTFDVETRFEEVTHLKASLMKMQAGLVSFKRFVPSKLVRQILARGEEARLGGEVRDVTILFSDLQGYSTLIEEMSSERIIEFMNKYFQAMQKVIERHQGVVLELQGDAILVLFGAPDDLLDHPHEAVQCALAMREGLEALNNNEELELKHRIGIHTGQVVAGNIGGESFMKYGVIGNTVVISARLEQLNKSFGTSILFSEEVEKQLPQELRDACKDHDEVELKGRTRPTRVYSL